MHHIDDYRTVTTTAAKSSEAKVAVCIEIPKTLPLALAELAPSGNIFGSILLNELLTTALRAESLLGEAHGVIGDLNDSFYVFDVLDRTTALKILRTTLGATGLLAVSIGGWLCQHELIWREAWNLTPHTLESRLNDDERMKRFSQEAKERTTAILAWKASLLQKP